MNDHWDCPSCGRPTPPEIDVECNCGMKSSHHLSVSAMCRILHSVTDREAALIVEKDKLIRQLAAERALADRFLQAVNLGRLKSSRVPSRRMEGGPQ